MNYLIITGLTGAAMWFAASSAVDALLASL